MENIRIPSEVVDEFGSSLVHVDIQMGFFFDEKSTRIQTLVSEMMASLSREDLDYYMSIRNFQSIFGHISEAAQQEEARKAIISELITDAINRKRSELLRSDVEISRPPPYDHDSLADLSISDENLIDISLLNESERNLQRNGFAFELSPSLPAFNSSYWLVQNLGSVDQDVSKYIRLDPLCVQPIESYRSLDYRMWVYGVPLDWKKILNLTEIQHGRWIPGALDTPSKFTDVVWSPRQTEVHFVCEEVPLADQVNKRGSRYLHSVFVPAAGYFIHVDGAIRFYSADELDTRHRTHVRNSGKIGHRVKIFRVEGIINASVWSALVRSFFVWNYDVMKYVAGEAAFPN